jgi:uncharacterized membrane protein
MFFWFLFLILFALLIGYLDWHYRQAPILPIKSEHPLEVLQKRYARDEIDTQDYLEKRKQLL